MHQGKYPIKLGLVGCGAQAKEHLRILRKVKDVQLVALCDVDQKAVASMANEWKVDHYYTNFSEMLDNENLSLVSIITPPQSHASLIMEAITHKVNLLVEKPLAMTTSEADLILESLKGSSVKLTVSYTLLFSRAMLRALALIRNGVIGEVLGMDIKMLQANDDPMAADENHWSHRLLGGRFGEMLSHPVYLVQSILGNDLIVDRVIVEKRGNLPWMKYDELYFTLRSTRGVAQTYVSFNAPRPELLIEIFGSKKILRIDLLNQTLIEVGHKTFSKIDSAKDCLNVSGTLVFQTARNALLYLLRRAGEDPTQMAYKSIVESTMKERELIVIPEMARSTVRITEEICNKL
jgi:predicted dehydrogenase